MLAAMVAAALTIAPQATAVEVSASIVRGVAVRAGQIERPSGQMRGATQPRTVVRRCDDNRAQRCKLHVIVIE